MKDIESVLAYWGIRGNNALTDEERTDGGRIAPAARLHTPNTDGTYLMHKPITDITFDDAKQTISFSFMGGTSTGIEDPCIGIPLQGDAVLRVYGIDGRLVQTCNESAIHSLPKGMYVLKNLSTGETSKRFVGR